MKIGYLESAERGTVANTHRKQPRRPERADQRPGRNRPILSAPMSRAAFDTRTELCESDEVEHSHVPAPGWMLDERANAGRENLDAGHVSRYDAKEDGDALSEVLLLQGLGLDETSTVLDLGAGTGQFTLAVAPTCARVVAVDVSPVMQAALRQKVAASGYRNIECISTGFLSCQRVRGLIRRYVSFSSAEADPSSLPLSRHIQGRRSASAPLPLRITVVSTLR